MRTRMAVWMMALLSLLAPFMVTVSTTAPAQADIPGCTSKWRLMGDNWSENRWYSDLDGGTFYNIRLTATTGYTWCKPDDANGRVKPRWVDFCYSHLNSSRGGPLFNGVKFNPYFYDPNTVTNPPTTLVPNDGSVQNCVKYNIPAEDERWLSPIGQGWASWKVTAWVRLVDKEDLEVVFHDDSQDHSKNFWPWNDVTLGDWQYN